MTFSFLDVIHGYFCSFLILMKPIYLWLFQFVKSNFFTSIVTASAGAFFGAYGAYRIAKKSKEMDALAAEIKHTNMAISLAYHIWNGYYELKRQHVKELYDDYNQKKIQHENAISEGKTAEFDRLNLHGLEPIAKPIHPLKEIAYFKLFLNAKPLNLINSLDESIEQLNQIIVQRNQMVKKYQERKDEVHHPEFLAMYFGSEFNGTIDQSYSQGIKNIYEITDDCIQFSYLLCKELMAHGKKIIAQSKTKRSINEVDFSEAFKKGLMPDQSSYLDWETSYKNKAIK